MTLSDHATNTGRTVAVQDPPCSQGGPRDGANTRHGPVWQGPQGQTISTGQRGGEERGRGGGQVSYGENTVD